MTIFSSISRAERIKLEVLNAAVSLNSLRVSTGNRLEQLKGNRKGQHSIWIKMSKGSPIKRHGGRIDVHSEVGIGSSFTIILPIEEASK